MPDPSITPISTLQKPFPTKKALAGAIFISIVIFFVSFEPRPDKPWQLLAASAPWAGRDRFASVAYENRMWVIAGAKDFWDGSVPKKIKFGDVWSSSDGSNWRLEAPEVPFPMRTYIAATTFMGKIWLIGGWDAEGHTSSEIWCSEDGREWREVTSKAPWGPRGASALVSFENKLWMFGGTKQDPGEDPTTYNDIWSSPDGEHWTKESDAAEWEPRGYHQVLRFKDKLWLIGGGEWVSKPILFDDVWNSNDGITWEKLASHAAWGKQLWESAAASEDSIWLTGGTTVSLSGNEGAAWLSSDGRVWRQYLGKAFPARRSHGSQILGSKLYVFGGSNFDTYNDVWRINTHVGARSFAQIAAVKVVYFRKQLGNWLYSWMSSQKDAAGS